MKSIFILSLSFLWNGLIGQQTPYFPIDNYAPTSGSLTVSAPFGMVAPTNTSTPVTISQSAEISFVAGTRLALHPGFSAGNFSGNGYFHGQIGNVPDFDVVFIEPNQNSPGVEKNEKLELGIRFPQNVEDAIHAFVSNLPLSQRINPYDPEQIDVQAQFDYIGNGATNGEPTTRKAFGFYYWDYARDLSDPNPGNWRLVSVPTDYHFRIRFAPTIIGDWNCTITANIPGYGNYTVGSIFFHCDSPSDPNNKGFVHTVSGSRWLQLGNETFLPVGQNIYDWGLTPYTGEDATVSQYVDYENKVKGLSDNGASLFRTILYPDNYEVEFEYLNNYTSRLDNVWELDQLVNVAHEKNIYMDMNMQIGTDWQIQGGDAHTFEDWSSGHCNNPADTGYCYHTELNLTYPEEILSNPQAISIYKKRLRYLVARYSYSRNIALCELVSEVNGVGSDFSVSGPNCDLGELIRYPYDDPNTSSIVRQNLYNWHYEMSRYLKEDLDFRHILTCNYTETGPEFGDESFSIPFFDVVDYDYYQDGLGRTKDYYDIGNRYNKPVFLSETGSPVKDLCGNFAEWKRTIWSLPFSGIAGGSNWSGENDPEVWNQFNFLKIFLDGFNLNFAWSSDYVISESNLVESNYLKQQTVNGNSNDKAIGVVINRTFNAYSMRTCENCDCTSYDPSMADYLDPRSSLMIPNYDLYYDDEIDDNQIRLTHMGVLEHYHIEWYNTFNGQSLESGDKYSDISGHLSLEFPDLYFNNISSSYFIRPIVAFKVFRFGDSFRFGSNNDSSQTTASVKIFPNPASDYFNVSVTGKDGNTTVRIYDVAMNLVYTMNSEANEFIIQTNFLSSGTYFIEVGNKNFIERKRISIIHS